MLLQVGPDEHVICALSGGVDSTVAATLVHQVVGDRLHCVFVDNGLLRFKVGAALGMLEALRHCPSMACSLIWSCAMPQCSTGCSPLHVGQMHRAAAATQPWS